MNSRTNSVVSPVEVSAQPVTSQRARPYGASLLTTSLGDILIERLTRTYLDDELAAAHKSVEHTRPWMEWCRSDLTRAELEGMFVAIERAWEQDDHNAFAILDAKSNAFLGMVGLIGRP
jgi:hypothetical protein